MGELANAAVLFSAHRRAGRKGASGLNREGFLGQVILPLRGLVHNLRPVLEPTSTSGLSRGPAPADDHPDQADGTHNNTDKRSGKHGEHGEHGQDRRTGDGDGGGNGDTKNSTNYCRSGRWRSLRGELRGVFPTADRRGRVAADGAAGKTSAPLRLRLRLSVSLSVKAVRRREGERGVWVGTVMRLVEGGTGLARTNPTLEERERESCRIHTPRGREAIGVRKTYGHASTIDQHIETNKETAVCGPKFIFRPLPACVLDFFFTPTLFFVLDFVVMFLSYNDL